MVGLLGILLILGMMYGGYYLVFKLPGIIQSNKFHSLGNMSGMTKSQIIAKCGRPAGVSRFKWGSACVWNKGRYRIEIQFDENDFFLAIAQETAP